MKRVPSTIRECMEAEADEAEQQLLAEFAEYAAKAKAQSDDPLVTEGKNRSSSKEKAEGAPDTAQIILPALDAMNVDVAWPLFAASTITTLTRLLYTCRSLKDATAEAIESKKEKIRPAKFDLPAFDAGFWYDAGYSTEGFGRSRSDSDVSDKGYPSSKRAVRSPSKGSSDVHLLEARYNCIAVLGGSAFLGDAPTELTDAELWGARVDLPKRLGKHLPDLLAPRADLAAVAIKGGWLYAIGGRCGTRDIASVDRLDMGTQQWSPMAPMVQPLSGMAAAAIRSYGILVAGGAAHGSYQATSLAQLYDVRMNFWHVVADMEQYRVCPAAIAIPGGGGQVVVVGGAMPDGELGMREEGGEYDPTLVELYHPDANTWVSAGKMSIGRHNCCAASDAHGRIVVLGGSDIDTGYTLASAEGLDLRMKRTVELAAMPVAVCGASAVSRGDRVLCMGGSVDAAGGKAVVSSRVFDYESRMDKWREMEPLQMPRCCAAACLLC